MHVHCLPITTHSAVKQIDCVPEFTFAYQFTEDIYI